MSDAKNIKIFIASSAEVKAERERCVLIINQLNKSHKHLHLEPVEWEYDMVKGNVPGYETIQKAINPYLQQSHVAIFIFYSRLGKNTKEEFELAVRENKKLFAYFKQGFIAQESTQAALQDLLFFKESLNDTVLYQDYNDLVELEKLIYSDLNLYVANTHPATTTATGQTKYSEGELELMRMIAKLSETINELKQPDQPTPAFITKDTMQHLIKEKEERQQQLLQSKTIQQQQAKQKAEIEQALTLQAKHDTYKKKALAEVQKGNYKNAENHLKESAKKNIRQQAATFYEMAKLKELQLQFNEALNYYELAANNAASNTLYIMEAGVMAENLASYDKALHYFEEGLNIDKRYYGAEHPATAAWYNNIGEVYKKNGEYKKAIVHYEQALANDIKYYGEGHPHLAVYYNNLGSAYYSMGSVYDIKADLNKASQYFEKALLLDKNHYGEDDPAVARDYNNLGLLYHNKKNYDKAIEYFEKAIAINKHNYGEEHPNIAGTYNNLGMAYNGKEDYDKSIQCYQKALAIGKKYYGEEHPNIASTYNNLGEVYRSAGDYDKAIEYYRLSLSIMEKLLPADHPYIHMGKANIELAQRAKDIQ